jgi:hypothetical protein
VTPFLEWGLNMMAKIVCFLCGEETDSVLTSKNELFVWCVNAGCDNFNSVLRKTIRNGKVNLKIIGKGDFLL